MLEKVLFLRTLEIFCDIAVPVQIKLPACHSHLLTLIRKIVFLGVSGCRCGLNEGLSFQGGAE